MHVYFLSLSRTPTHDEPKLLPIIPIGMEIDHPCSVFYKTVTYKTKNSPQAQTHTQTDTVTAHDNIFPSSCTRTIILITFESSFKASVTLAMY